MSSESLVKGIPTQRTSATLLRLECGHLIHATAVRETENEVYCPWHQAWKSYTKEWVFRTDEVADSTAGPSNATISTERIYRCHVNSCGDYMVTKTVRLQHIGQNLFVGSDPICGGCGRVPVRVS